MRTLSPLRGFTRQLIPGVALGAVACAAAVAPAQAAGPPMQIDKEVEMNCSLVTPFFTVPNLQLFVRVHATVPSNVTTTDQVFIRDSYAEIRIPAQTAGALSVVSADTVDGIADVFNLALTKASPSVVNVTADPVAYGPQLVPSGQETTMRVPNSGTLPDVGPITSAGASPGDVIDARLTRLETMLHATNSTNPSIDQNLPFFCDNKEGADNLVSTIPVVEGEVTPPLVIPDATSVSPSSVTAGTAASVTLSGTDLGVVNSVKLNGSEATFTKNSNGTITVDVPAQPAAGSVSIVVAGPDGADTTAVSLTVNAAPVDPTPDLTEFTKLECLVTTPYFTVPGTVAYIRVNSDVPVGVTQGGNYALSNTYADIYLPAGYLAVELPGFTDRQATLNGLTADLTNTTPGSTQLVAQPTASNIVTTSSSNGAVTLRVPASGVLPAVAPVTAGLGGSSITARVGAVDFDVASRLEGTGPFSGNLSYDCAPAADADTLIGTTLVAHPPLQYIPNATSVAPAAVTVGQAASVTLSGTYLHEVNSVKLNGVATTFNVNANGTVTVNVPAQSQTGSIAIVVAGADGADTTPVTLQVQAAPTTNNKPVVKKLLPNQALSLIGGVSIVSGSNLSSATKVTVGGKNASFVKLGNTLIVVLPGLKKGTYDLVVTNKDGSSTASSASKVKYIGLF